MLWLSARWGGAFTPLLVAFFLDYVTWRRAFEIFGLVGVIWAIAFYRWYRDDPRTHPSVNEAELALLPPPARTATVHGPIPWERFLTRPAVWLLWIQYVCLCYGWWFYITWLPTYLRDARGLGLKQGALLAGLPLFLGGLGCLVAGYLAPHLARRTGSVARSRRILAVTGFVCAVDRHHRVHAAAESDARHPRAGHLELLQRLRDADVVGGVHGHGRPLFRDALGQHEHDGQHRAAASRRWWSGISWRGPRTTGR